MANDVTNKSTSSSGTGNVVNQPEGNNSTPATDQQKVPPLRIVLNTSGNQKSSSTISSIENEQIASNKREKQIGSQDTHHNTLKSRVRIKLGTNKQQVNNNNSKEKSSNESITNKSTGTSRNSTNDDNFNDDTSSSFSHLRRITRRSQRTIQSINNEDEESISSMTSIDENIQNPTNNTTSDLVAQDSEQSNLAAVSNTSALASATNGSTSADTPRRYKRRKGEPSESQSLDFDIFGSQNYKLPDQNSIELFKNIRKQVDKRLKNLSSIQPRAPYGFRDYILSRGSYLLDGNKLGNGTNLFLNEDGGLNPLPVGKYHPIRQNRVNYTVPNRAKVPSGLPVNSALYNLFIDQEKERHRMRMQHIKEREKLTLAAEQEIIRVYNQAALLASNQAEPFSACTMLKHQEIYDYLNSDGKIILSRENAQHEEVKTDGVRTRRRQHGQISPSTATVTNSRKDSNIDDTSVLQVSAVVVNDEKVTAPVANVESTTITPVASAVSEVIQKESETDNAIKLEVNEQATGDNQSDTHKEDKMETSEASDFTIKEKDKKSSEDDESISPKAGQAEASGTMGETEKKAGDEISMQPLDSDRDVTTNNVVKEESIADESTKVDSINLITENSTETRSDCPGGYSEVKNSTSTEDDAKLASSSIASCELSEQNSEESQIESSAQQQQNSDSSSITSTDEDRINRNRETFLTQLQEVDDKWDKMRKEMLIRHRNEADSLYAIQKLEWEWKTKEIGACDIRATPVIDTTLVPKLAIYPQDY